MLETLIFMFGMFGFAAGWAWGVDDRLNTGGIALLLFYCAICSFHPLLGLGMIVGVGLGFFISQAEALQEFYKKPTCP